MTRNKTKPQSGSGCGSDWVSLRHSWQRESVRSAR
jgi:hypothetical protein